MDVAILDLLLFHKHQQEIPHATFIIAGFES